MVFPSFLVSMSMAFLVNITMIQNYVTMLMSVPAWSLKFSQMVPMNSCNEAIENIDLSDVNSTRGIR